jgi:hypothetical protein
MTPQQLKAELRYRYEERLGILAGSGPATREQRLIAWRECLAWRRRVGK